MKEKIMAFLQNEKVKENIKRVFNKRNLKKVVIVIIIAAALKITYSFAFEVKGYVSRIDGSKITVVNYLTTQTVDIGSFINTLDNIQVGDKIVIKKNLSGQVMSVKDINKDKRLIDKHNFRDFNGHYFKRR
ncbi:hypothetical protein FDN13_03845 [Caloramator sp. E03]|uniref:hypothetical protein n=1 Tax=Caloramator sp. E03 TaxID=2576307 RepID=UPI0011108C42|nr:hypothetical protein [Caloramator sp. E03]QCX32911.1 hypothetical protein FDN13_03845 [Caloramator sp. E03]